MSSAFKPLAPGLPGAGSRAAAKAASAGELAGQFRPLGVSGENTPKAIVTHGPSVTHTHAPAPAASQAAAPPAAPAPKVSTAVTRLIRDGDRITHIEIRCGCGELITLECGYAPQS